MIRNLFFDAFFALFVIVLFLSGVFFVRPAMSSTGIPVRAASRQNWSAQPVYDYSRNLWNQVEGALFHQDPKKGVLIGNDAWLTAGGSYPCPASAAKNLDANLDYVVAARNLLAERNTTLLVVLIPANGHPGASHRPSCQRHVYDKALGYMDRHRVPVADLRTTTSPLNIRNGAVLQDAQLVPSGSFAHWAGFPAPPMIQMAEAGNSLTDATASARPSFAHFLSETLRADFVNVAAQGQGPFTVMDAYLRNAAWTGNPPDVLVWEIPERCLLARRGARRP